MIWLSVICSALAVVTVLLIVRIVSIERDVGAIDAEFTEKLLGNTNTPITVRGGSKAVRRLANDVNGQLKLLRKQRLKYERGDAELKNAVANISHDLRTPLTAISGYLDMLRAEQKSADAERYIGVIANRVEVLKQLSDELFKYSVVTSPDYGSQKERVSVNAVLEECVAEHYAALRKAGIAPQISMPEHAVYCMANRVALSRIFSNLISNAVKYSDGDLSITLADNAEIEFCNTSSALSETEVNKLFDRFFTVESARKSTGLGLSIAKVLAEHTGGTISADYTNGKLFIRVCLPLADATGV